MDHREEEHVLGLTWVIEELMQRASHALADDGRVWLVDPVDVDEAVAHAAELGTPQAVIQLLDRHNRDCAEIAERLGVPHLRLPDSLPGTPFEVVKVIDVPRWRELALWWPDRRALVVSEALGSGPYFAPGDDPVGIHPFLRLHPPRAPRRYEPEHLLFGHGSCVHGGRATEELRRAYDRSLRDIPKVLLSALPGRR